MKDRNYTRVDCHIHYSLPIDPQELVDVLDHTDTDIANLVIVPHRQRISSVPDAMMVKHMYPERFLRVFQPGHHAILHASRTCRNAFRPVRQEDAGVRLRRRQDDRRKTGIAANRADSGFRRRVVGTVLVLCGDASGLPILWHVNDPEEFWDAEKIPSWAKSRGWFYGSDTINNEVQYTQVLNVLERHPNLKIIFAHFFFMSAQLPRLADLLDRYPRICIDLTPGIEMYVNLSKQPEKTRAFFEKYQDRILYGTDIGARSVAWCSRRPHQRR
ncbi:MAG: amidohydrolase family protein [Comamonadaceae bacterium]|nr:amidohydrolase family protein [Comamonadaceae bacterium]